MPTATSYVKGTDPYRISERHVRREVQAASPINGVFEVLEQGRFRPGDHTAYGAVAVLCTSGGGTYSVHTAVVRSDGPESDPRLVYVIVGDYDLDLATARERLAER